VSLDLLDHLIDDLEEAVVAAFTGNTLVLGGFGHVGNLG
jgi:hypothetical protein